MASPSGKEPLRQQCALGRGLSGVSGALDALPHRLLFLLSFKAARLYPAFYSTAHHSDRRLPEPLTRSGKGHPSLAACAACAPHRFHYDNGSAAAVVYFSCSWWHAPDTRDDLGN